MNYNNNNGLIKDASIFIDTNQAKNLKKQEKNSFLLSELEEKYKINVKGKIIFPFLQKIDLDLSERS